MSSRRKKVLTKRVQPQWYQRYMYSIPSQDRIFLQPIKELKEEEELFRAMATPTKAEDRTEELVKALAHEKTMKIQMVLAMVNDDPKKMRQRIALIKPPTSPLKYALDKEKAMAEAHQFKFTDHSGQPLSFAAYLSFLGLRRCKPDSKWRLLNSNKVIRQKIRTLIREVHRLEITRKWGKAIRQVRAVLRFFQIIAHIARTTAEVFKKFIQPQEFVSTETSNNLMVFDKSYFKAVKHGRELDTETLFTLGKPEHYRTWPEVQKAAEKLKFIRSFSALPEHYQVKLAMIAWYMEIPGDKVIIREGHVADSFYFLISGRVVAVKLVGSPLYEKHSRFSVLKIFEKDDIFGEEGISNRSHRNYSVTTTEKSTLLSVNIDDYYRIFNTSITGDENPDHIRLLSQLDFMKYFPVQELIQNSEGNIILFYYSKGSIITKQTSTSEYIYVVKSGTVKLMTKLKGHTPIKRYKCVNITMPPKARRKSRYGVGLVPPTRRVSVAPLRPTVSQLSAQRKSIKSAAFGEMEIIRNTYGLDSPIELEEEELKSEAPTRSEAAMEETVYDPGCVECPPECQEYVNANDTTPDDETASRGGAAPAPAKQSASNELTDTEEDRGDESLMSEDANANQNVSPLSCAREAKRLIRRSLSRLNSLNLPPARPELKNAASRTGDAGRSCAVSKTRVDHKPAPRARNFSADDFSEIEQVRREQTKGVVRGAPKRIRSSGGVEGSLPAGHGVRAGGARDMASTPGRTNAGLTLPNIGLNRNLNSLAHVGKLQRGKLATSLPQTRSPPVVTGKSCSNNRKSDKDNGCPFGKLPENGDRLILPTVETSTSGSRNRNESASKHLMKPKSAKSVNSESDVYSSTSIYMDRDSVGDLDPATYSACTIEDSVSVMKRMQGFMSRLHSRKNAAVSEDLKSNTEIRTTSLMKAASVEKFLLHNNVEEESYVWVCVKTLHESDVFGLEDLDLGDPRDETESNMALVSDGAEVILISKKFFMDNAGPNLLADLRASSYIMPDLKTLTLDLQKREFWAKYQEKVVDASFREMNVTRKVKKHR